MALLQQVTDYAALVYFVLMILFIFAVLIILLIIKRKLNKLKKDFKQKIGMFNELRHITKVVRKIINYKKAR